MGSWVKKELDKLKIYQFTGEVALEADLGCPGCQKRVADVISSFGDLESIVVHVTEKKVVFAPKPSSAKLGSVDNKIPCKAS